MKYYHYISERKVDMLLEQEIPHDARMEIATQLKIDLKVLSCFYSATRVFYRRK